MTHEINLDDIFDENGYKNNIDPTKYNRLKCTNIKLYRTKNTSIRLGDNFLAVCISLISID